MTVGVLAQPRGPAERAIALLENGPRVAILAGAGIEHDAAAAALRTLAER